VPDACDPIRAELAALERQLANTERWIVEPPEPGERGPRPHPRANPVYLQLQNRIASARQSLAACERSLLPRAQPVPVTLSMSGLKCFDQNDTDRGTVFDVEDDEPYVLAYAVDLAAVQNSKLTKIGPMSGVDEGFAFSAPANVIWGLSGVAQQISSANNLICLVALMENDDANTDTVRTVVETAVQLSLGRNFPAFITGQIPRDELVRRMMGDMNGSIAAASIAVPGPDDHIGSTQELRFTQDELDDIYRVSRVVEKKLYFEGDDAKYDVYLRMAR
jgi:hypothetical protein